MTEVAHALDCSCEACMAGRPAEYKQPAKRNWESDAVETGKIHKATGKNLWHAAYLVAVNTQPSKGGRPAKETANSTVAVSRVSFRQFAEKAGITDVTVGRYYATWQAAAQHGLVPDASTLGNSEPKAILGKLSTDDWSDNYPKREVAAPVSSVSGSKASGAAKPVSRASRGAAASAKDRSPSPDATELPGKPTGSRDPVIVVTPDQVITSPDSFVLESVKDATTDIRILGTELEGEGPFDDDMLKALEEFFNAVESVKNLVMPRILGNQPKPSATVVARAPKQSAKVKNTKEV